MGLSSFIGRRFVFPLQLNDRNRFALVGDDAAIRQSIFLIIHTVPGERVMRPEFGCLIHDLIFSPIDDETLSTAERYVREALERWEPRIVLERVTASAGAYELGELIVHIEYLAKDSPDPRSMVFPYYLIPKG